MASYTTSSIDPNWSPYSGLGLLLTTVSDEDIVEAVKSINPLKTQDLMVFMLFISKNSGGILVLVVR